MSDTGNEPDDSRKELAETGLRNQLKAVFGSTYAPQLFSFCETIANTYKVLTHCVQMDYVMVPPPLLEILQKRHGIDRDKIEEIKNADNLMHYTIGFLSLKFKTGFSNSPDSVKQTQEPARTNRMLSNALLLTLEDKHALYDPLRGRLENYCRAQTFRPPHC